MSTPSTKQHISDQPHPTRWLSRNIFGIGVTSFFSDLSHETATTILPVFLISIGASASALGIIEGVADALSSFAKIGAGWYSDRTGIRKPIAVIGYFLTGIAKASFAFATSWYHVLAGRAAGWLGRGIRNPIRDAIMAESAPPEAYGRAFGFDRALDTVGAVLGPITALWLVTFLTYRNIFLLTLIPGMLATLVFAVFVRAKTRAPNRELSFALSVKKLPSKFKIFLVGVGIFGMGDFAHTLLILRATEVLRPPNPENAGKLAITLYVIHNIIYAAASYPVGAIADKVGKRGFLALGYLLSAAMCIGFVFSPPSFWYLALLFFVGGFYIAIEDSLERAISADLLPEELRGTGYGALATVNGIGDFISSIIVGILWTTISPAAGFSYAAVLSLLGATVLLRLR